MKGFTVQAQLTSMKPLKDRGMSLSFHTQELPSSEKAELIDHLDNAGWLLFKENEVDMKDVPDIIATETESKTPSQRLRSVLYVRWVQKKFKVTFDDYYKKALEHFINEIKATLEDNGT